MSLKEDGEPHDPRTSEILAQLRDSVFILRFDVLAIKKKYGEGSKVRVDEM